MPETVVYREDDWKKIAGPYRNWQERDQLIKGSITQMWEEQYKIARKESYFTTKFLGNFKTILQQFIKI